jgi:hypothetical protein
LYLKKRSDGTPRDPYCAIVITGTRLDMKHVNIHDRMEDCSELSRGKLRGTRRRREIIKDDNRCGFGKV